MFADSKRRAQEVSNDYSFVLFNHQLWDLEGVVKLTPPQHILVFKYPSRDRVKRIIKYTIPPVEIISFWWSPVHCRELQMLKISYNKCSDKYRKLWNRKTTLNNYLYLMRIVTYKITSYANSNL